MLTIFFHFHSIFSPTITWKTQWHTCPCFRSAILDFPCVAHSLFSTRRFFYSFILCIIFILCFSKLTVPLQWLFSAGCVSICICTERNPAQIYVFSHCGWCWISRLLARIYVFSLFRFVSQSFKIFFRSALKSLFIPKNEVAHDLHGQSQPNSCSYLTIKYVYVLQCLLMEKSQMEWIWCIWNWLKKRWIVAVMPTNSSDVRLSPPSESTLFFVCSCSFVVRRSMAVYAKYFF